MPKNVEINITYKRERYRNGEFVIGLAYMEDHNDHPWKDDFAIIKGEADPERFTTGGAYRLRGQWESYMPPGLDQRAQKQFRFTSFTPAAPLSEQAVVAYLQQAPGVGPTTAERLWKEFEGAAVKQLREKPDYAASVVPRFSAKKAKEAAAWLKERQADENSQIELIELLRGRGFPKRLAKAAVSEWGSAAAASIRRNPYALMRFAGVGFLGTDRMYLDLGGNPQSLRRQALAAWHAMAVAGKQDGHVWFPLGFAKQGIRNHIGGTETRPNAAIELARRGKVIAVRIDDNGREWAADIRQAGAERNIVESIETSLDEPAEWPCP